MGFVVYLNSLNPPNAWEFAFPFPWIESKQTFSSSSLLPFTFSSWASLSLLRAFQDYMIDYLINDLPIKLFSSTLNCSRSPDYIDHLTQGYNRNTNKGSFINKFRISLYLEVFLGKVHFKIPQFGSFGG